MVAYLDVASVDGTTDLWLRNRDGSQPRLLLPARPGFLALFSPRFSPDGRTLLISAAPDATSSGALAYADGFPEDFYAVPVSGGPPQRLTTIGGDRPSAAWSSDGQWILFNDITGLFVMAADGSGLTRLGDGYQHAQIAWRDH
jgi:TolB protein